MPTIDPRNIKFEFENSVLKAQDNSLFGVSVSKILIQDEYIDVIYSFWNDAKVNQILTSNDEIRMPNRLVPNARYTFQNLFSIKYDTFRFESLIEISVASIIVILAFIGGALWGKGQK